MLHLWLEMMSSMITENSVAITQKWQHFPLTCCVESISDQDEGGLGPSELMYLVDDCMECPTQRQCIILLHISLQ